MNTSKQNHAIVIGGSVAGLMTARVLSAYYARVTVIERDDLPLDASYRNGAPQARHLHVLLARGQQIMERYFPGLSDEMTASTAPTLRIGVDNLFHTVAGWSRESDIGMRVNTIGRASLEWLVRQRVLALPNVTFMLKTDVEGLLMDGDTIIGVTTQARHQRENATTTLHADLVVDASGRRSHAPEWLNALGYAAPDTTIINCHCGYASRWYQLPADAIPAKKLVAIQTNAREQGYRGGAYMVTENNTLVVTLLGANADYPPTDEADFMEYMRSLPVPTLYELVQRATPISPIVAYRGLQNQMRHYDKLTRRPENFLVLGDAAIAFNPIYGQGMSSAAMQAELLDMLLQTWHKPDLRGLAAQFQRGIVKLTQGAWQLSISEDMRYPMVEGKQLNLPDRVLHLYTDLTLLAAVEDVLVGKVFIDVMNLLKTPNAFLRPDIFARVMWQTARRALRKNAAPAHQPTAAYQGR